MLVRAVARVDNRRAADTAEEVRRPGHGVTHHDEVGIHGFEIARRVKKGLALDDAAGPGREVERVGRETFFRKLERGACPRARLEEQVDHRLSPKRGDLLDFTLRDLGKGVGGVEDQGDLLGCQLLDAQKVSAVQLHPGPPYCPAVLTISTASRPSNSLSETLISWPRE